MSRSRFAAGLCSLVAATVVAAPSRAQLAQPSLQSAPPIGGITCDAQEGSRIHIHQHLLILEHGKPVTIPASIGIPEGKRCIYWVHTHTPDGIIHIEAPKDRSFTLGDFFLVWNKPLSKTQVADLKTTKGESIKVWVDGKPYTGDPRKIGLAPHTDIVIEFGPPFPTPPRFMNWGTL